jgi:GTP-binding protein
LFVSEDELIEVTPTKIRLRKKALDENARKKVRQQKKAED